MRPVRPVRGDLPGARDRADAAAALAPEARQPRVLNEAVIFHCISLREAARHREDDRDMLAKLAGHSMFAAPGALDRLRMCADCRVVDLMKNERGVDIRDV